MRGVVTVLFVASVVAGAATSEAQQPGTPPAPTATSGRVVVTISVESIRLPAVVVELLDVTSNVVIARTTSDGVGQTAFPDVPAGSYLVRTVRDGFANGESLPFEVRPGLTEQVLVEMRLTFIRESIEVVVPANSPTDSLQPVAVSDVLTGAKMDIQPLAGDDFQSLLTMLPSVIRGPEGRLRVKGGAPTTGALQLSSASLNDPSTGDFDLELPSGAVESVEVLSNPFAAEYGRFSTSVTQVRTRRGTNEWVVTPGNLLPGLGRGVAFVNRFEPRLSLSGPLKRDRLLLGQHFQYRFARTAVRSLPGNPQLGVDSFDSFTRLDAVVSSSHAVTAAMIYFPRKITNPTLSTFRPAATTPTFTQEGFSAGLADRLILSGHAVLESTATMRAFEVDQKTRGAGAMVYAPQSQGGDFFGHQERDVRSLQVVEALTVSKDDWAGQHIFKAGIDVQHSRFDGESYSQTLEVRRLDGSLAERTTFAPAMTFPKVKGTEVALFLQDRWRVTDWIMFELGIRADRDDVVERVNVSPRAGMAVTVLPDGRGILRGGIGKFVERTPLIVGAFTQYETPTVTRFLDDGRPAGAPVTLVHTVDGVLTSPESIVRTVAWDQRVGRRLFLKAGYVNRSSSHAFVVAPDRAAGRLGLSSTGVASYWELETTARYLANERRDLTVSYVRSHSTRDLNDYDEFYGNFRNPVIRSNERSLSPTDVPHRLLVRGSIGLPGRWVLSPVYEVRSGFPWSAVDQYQDFVGPRNRTGRLPTVSSLDFTVVRPMRLRRLRFTGGLKVYNAFNSGNERDVQANVSSPDYGTFYNPIRRSIGFVLTASRP